MCLYVNRIKTEQELKNRDSRIFYKIFVKGAGALLLSPYWAFPIHKPGRIVLPDPVKLGKQEMIDKGVFHVRTSEGALKQDSFYCEFFERGEPVEVIIHANHKDIIAFGIQDDVALKAYTITEETWNSIFPQ